MKDIWVSAGGRLGLSSDMTHLGQLHFLYIYPTTHFLRLPAARLLQNITTCFRTEDGGWRRREVQCPTGTMAGAPDGNGSPLSLSGFLATDQKIAKAELGLEQWQAQTHSESWSDVSKMASALSPILHCTAPLSLTIAFILRFKFQFFCCEYLLMEICSAK